MMNMFDSFAQNGVLVPWHQIMPFVGLLLPLILLDIGLKAWGMWRAARMGKNIWFIALLLVNSLGILPAVFLLLTKEEYDQTVGKMKK
jgi:hypothetical protein